MNRIGLIDIDGHNYPNLALMKLSAWHKAQGDSVEFVNHLFEYDKVYQSKVFSFTPNNTTYVHASSIIKGGTGYNVSTQLPDQVEHTYPDYSLYSYPHALGFLTRGCVRKCSFCIVPQKEGALRANAEITEFWSGQKTAILMDNNVLASDHGLKQIEKIIDLGIRVDFNQGLDARYIARHPDIAQLLSKVKWYMPLRMACDTLDMLPIVIKATELLRKYDTKPVDYFVYILVKENIDDALYIVNELKKINIEPFAQPLVTETIIPTREQKQFARWVNHRAIFKTVEYKDYKGCQK